MAVKLHTVVQGTPEWFAARCGLLTASEMKLIITPAKLQYASNDKERGHLYELAAQRVNQYVEPTFCGDDMLRGKIDEVDARAKYAEKYAPGGVVQEVGFVTNDKWGFTLGCSPDGLVGDDGVIECKSRKQKLQFEAIVTEEVPVEICLQLQTLLLVTERKWVDSISFCGGMPMWTHRIYPDATTQTAILAAAKQFHDKLDNVLKVYGDKLKSAEIRLTPTERRVQLEELKEGVYE